MSNVMELMRNLDRAVDDTVVLVDALDLFNSALRDLASVAKIPAKVILPFTVTDLSKLLPTNLVELRSVDVDFGGGIGKYQMGELAGKHNMRVEDNLVIEWDTPMLYAGDIIARYYRMPIMLADIADVPELPEHCHNALVYFAAREFYAADDEPALSAERGAQYMQEVAKLALHVEHRGATGQPIIVNAAPPWARRR